MPHSWHKNSDTIRCTKKGTLFFSSTATYSCMQVHHQELKKHRKLCVHACQVIDTRARSCFSSYFWLGGKGYHIYRLFCWSIPPTRLAHGHRFPSPREESSYRPETGRSFQQPCQRKHISLAISLSPLQPVLPAIARLRRTSEV